MSAVWRIANDGSSKRRWFVWRPIGTGPQMDIASDTQDRYRRFASPQAAQKVADFLNSGVDA